MKKVTNSFGGILIGIILVIVGTILLWWNEGNNVKNINTTNEVEKNAVEIKSDEINSNDDKLVLVSDKQNVIDDALYDDLFNITIKSSKLERYVEMYQWDENEHTEDDRTTYSYEKKWDSEIIDSSNFHNSNHTNPTSYSVESKTFSAQEVKIGEFYLSANQISKLPANSKIDTSDVKLSDGYTYQNQYITTSKDINNPEIGDIRITYKFNNWNNITVLANKKGNTFTDYISKDNKSVNRVENGKLTISEVVSNMRNENNTMKWILRGLGLLLIFIGYVSILSPLTTIASFVPILGDLVGSVLTLIAFLISLIQSLFIIIIAWFRFRPMLSIILIGVIVILVFVMLKLLKSKKGTV